MKFVGSQRWGESGIAWSPVIHPEDAARYEQEWLNGLNSGVSFQIEARLAPDATITGEPGRLSVSPCHPLPPVESESTRPWGWVVSWLPVPPPIAEKPRPRSIAALEQVGLGLWYCNVGHDTIEVDETCRAHFGWPPETEVTWNHFFDRLHPGDREATREAITRAIETGSAYDIEYRVVIPTTGETRWIRAIGRSSASEGVPIRFDGITIDVTQRKQVEQHLRQLAAVVERSNELIGLAGLDGTIWYLNEAGLRMLGLDTLDTARGSGIRRFLVDEDQHRLTREIVPKVHRTGRWMGELRLKNAGNAEPLHVWCDAFRVDDPQSGEPLCLATVTRDISTQKRNEQALRVARDRAEEASRAKDRFLAMLSHELRTPLTPVLLAAGELQSDPTTPPSHREALDLIRQNVALEARLIDDLLDVSGVTRTRPAPRRERIQARSLIARVVEIVRPDVESNRLDLLVSDPPERDDLIADPNRLVQVLWNLVSNAVKFTPRGGSIRIETTPVDGSLVIEVSDTGVGIDQEAMPRIFNAFEQAEDDPAHRPGGLGLGLAISRTIVEAHGGTLTARSDGPGRGATFAISLPLAESIKESESSPVTPRPDAPLNTMADPAGAPGDLVCHRILFVEDDPMTARVMARLLRRCGHTVTTANTLKAALEAAKSNEFDVVVSDLGLPDGTGLDLMRSMRARSDVPGIALTGYGTDDDLRRSVEAGFVAHLTKPVDFETLEAMIRRVMEPLHHDRA
ncbi:MAG: ATP-binding protein [Isosphaeraceae bacterium]